MSSSAKNPALILRCPTALAEEVVQGFADILEAERVTLGVVREDRGPYAGVEWLLPTALVVFVTKSYFDGFLKEAGKDHYQALKKGMAWLWTRVSTPRVTAVASAPGKLAPNERYTRALSIMARGQPGTIKLLIGNDATPEELAAATEAYLRLLESLDAGPSATLRYHGTVAIVAYDAATDSLRQVDPDSGKTEPL